MSDKGRHTQFVYADTECAEEVCRLNYRLRKCLSSQDTCPPTLRVNMWHLVCGSFICLLVIFLRTTGKWINKVHINRWWFGPQGESCFIIRGRVSQKFFRWKTQEHIKAKYKHLISVPEVIQRETEHMIWNFCFVFILIIVACTVTVEYCNILWWACLIFFSEQYEIILKIKNGKMFDTFLYVNAFGIYQILTVLKKKNQHNF